MILPNHEMVHSKILLCWIMILLANLGYLPSCWVKEIQIVVQKEKY